jgi:hypothetical protein
VQQRVDDDAHAQQLRDGGERWFSRLKRHRWPHVAEVSPRRRDQRARSIGQHEHEVHCAAPMRPAQHRQRAPFERMALAYDGHLLGEAVEVVAGSMSCRSSGASTTRS